MKRILKMELHKAFHGRLFLVTLLIAAGIALLQVSYHAERYSLWQESLETAAHTVEAEYNPSLPEVTLFNSWLCIDYQSLAAALFWFLTPIFVSLAYGWSLCMERKTGYIKNIAVRTTKRSYYLAKLAATFVSGGSVVALPAGLNLMAMAMFLPAVSPDVYYDICYPILPEDMFSQLFFSHPVGYALIRLLVVFVFGGAMATAAYSLSFFLKNRAAVTLLPFLLALGVSYLQALIPMEQHYAEFSPIYLLGQNGPYSHLLVVVVTECVILMGVSLALALGKGGREDVF